VDTDLANHEGPLTAAQGTIYQSVALLVIFYFWKYLTDSKLTNTFKLNIGAAAPSWLALLPPNVEGPKGEYIWHDKQIVDWVNLYKKTGYNFL